MLRVLLLSILLNGCASHSVKTVEEAPPPPPAKVRFFETVFREDGKLRKLICHGGICRYMEIEAKSSALSLRTCSIQESQLFWNKLPSEAVVSEILNAKCEDRTLDNGITAFYVESQDE